MDKPKKLKATPAAAVRLYDFQGLIGHELQVKRFASLHAAGRLPQALLIEGRRGLGKRLLAAALASLPFCEYGTGCGCCQGCRSVIDDDNADILWLESGDAAIKIDEIKSLQEHLSIQPAQSHFSELFLHKEHNGYQGRRIAIIVDADLMTDQAANRLLKTLEEPAPYAMIIMTTSRWHNLMATVLSRVTRWHVSPPEIGDSLQFIKQQLIAGQRAIPDDDKLSQILLQSGLCPGEALRRLRDIDDERDAFIENNLAKLILGKDPAQVLAAAESLGRDSGLTLNDLLYRMEFMLNRSYRAACDGNEVARGAISAGKISRRRELLREIRRYAGRGRVALNSQLMLESLGFCEELIV